ncbi:hypothetical protein TCAL_12837 [Tigriopus californicus]|uniref:Uncharacterized protein n=1 Tax=Tigriopus californicus TaxID=6832 RepID=A0A553NT87_TIGCA|nr:hypothetical protein TCAL_12837 [Tigriopus californicus]
MTGISRDGFDVIDYYVLGRPVLLCLPGHQLGLRDLEAPSPPLAQLHPDRHPLHLLHPSQDPQHLRFHLGNLLDHQVFQESLEELGYLQHHQGHPLLALLGRLDPLDLLVDLSGPFGHPHQSCPVFRPLRRFRHPLFRRQLLDHQQFPKDPVVRAAPLVHRDLELLSDRELQRVHYLQLHLFVHQVQLNRHHPFLPQHLGLQDHRAVQKLPFVQGFPWNPSFLPDPWGLLGLGAQ